MIFGNVFHSRCSKWRHFLEMCEFSINYRAFNVLLNVSLNSVCKYAGLLSQLMMWQFRCDILAIFDIHLHTCNIIFYFIFFVIASSLAHPTRCLHYQDKTAVAPCSNCTKSQPLRRRTFRARSTSRWYCKQNSRSQCGVLHNIDILKRSAAVFNHLPEWNADDSGIPVRS